VVGDCPASTTTVVVVVVVVVVDATVRSAAGTGSASVLPHDAKSAATANNPETRLHLMIVSSA